MNILKEWLQLTFIFLVQSLPMIVIGFSVLFFLSTMVHIDLNNNLLDVSVRVVY
ncbi:MAG: hypothetical protein NT091_00665 [Candidatus Falkowbacteria bacterium]|nr:hypothetical protein [Candidatus Falkowbacteria bacterium]